MPISAAAGLPGALPTVDTTVDLGYRLPTAQEGRWMAKTLSRWHAMKQAHPWYKRKFKWMVHCIYCGEPANTKDHVFPLTHAAELDLSRPNVREQLLPHGLCLVPACASCNNTALDKPFVSILQKRRWIQEKLRRKFRKRLQAPEWEEDELNELGHSLRAYVTKMEIDAKTIWRRVNWPKLRRTY